MIELLNPLYHQLIQTRQQFFEKLRSFDGAQLSFQPKPNQWSMLEVMHHLILVEELVLDYVQKKLQSPLETLPKKGLKSSLTSAMIRFVLKFPVKVKIPTDRVKPEKEQTLTELSSQWNTLQDRWNALMEIFQAGQESCLVFRHPIGGPWSIVQTLQFVPEHIRHHLIQIERIRQHPQFPVKNHS
ncbi:MAG: DinB family protein [Planctomycetota bacterium]